MSALKPLEFLYEKAAGLKNTLYDNHYLKPLKLPVPVISLGNLTVGGTGKTPLTHFCLQHFQKKNIRTAVVSRNYKADVKTIAKVDLSKPNAAKFFGDEPVLLASRNPQTSFFVGPEKFKTAEWAYQKEAPEVILVDDGFQHRQLARDLDLVILDATEAWARYRCLPVGRAREPWSALERADAFLISKANLVSAEVVEKLVQNLQPFQKPISQFEFHVSAWRNLQGAVWSGASKGEKVLLVSGIARPQSFEKNLQKFLPHIQDHIRFNDHHQYAKFDVEKILTRWKDLGKPTLVTTEKDCVKLSPLWPEDVPLWVAPLEVRIVSKEEAFYEVLDRVLA